MNTLIFAPGLLLNVHSLLEAVGLTAAFATALKQGNISCNRVAAYFPDRIISKEDAERAMETLRKFCV